MRYVVRKICSRRQFVLVHFSLFVKHRMFIFQYAKSTALLLFKTCMRTWNNENRDNIPSFLRNVSVKRKRIVKTGKEKLIRYQSLLIIELLQKSWFYLLRTGVKYTGKECPHYLQKSSLENVQVFKVAFVTSHFRLQHTNAKDYIKFMFFYHDAWSNSSHKVTRMI